MSRKLVLAMTLTLILIGMLTLTFNIQRAECSELPPTEWTKTYGGTTDEQAYCVVKTSDGGYALAGYTSSYGAGSTDFWLVKVDSAGNHKWNKTYGGAAVDWAYSVVETSDGGYAIAGHTNSFGAGNDDFWLVKVDSSGNMEWNKTYGGAAVDPAYSVVETSDGGYAIAGYTVSFAEGGWDAWLVKVDSSGNHQWNKTYGGTSYDVARSVVETSDGGYAIAGYTMSFGEGFQDFWLVKVDSSGNHEWNKTYGGANNDRARSVVETCDGGYAIAGRTDSFAAGGWDAWLVKVDSSGNHQWNKTYGGTSYDVARSVVETSDGGYAIAGWTDSFGEGSWDAWLVKVDSSGNHQWNKTYGGASNDAASSIVETGDGGYALAGWTYSFGANGDFWLVKVGVATKIFHVVVDSADYTVTISSNSRVSNFAFNETYAVGDRKGETSFNVSGSTCTTGFCNVTIPTNLTKVLPGEVWLVLVGGNDTSFDLSGSNATHTCIYFTYHHGATPSVVQIYGTGVVPEFPSFLILPLFMTATLLAVIVYRRKRSSA